MCALFSFIIEGGLPQRVLKRFVQVSRPARARPPCSQLLSLSLSLSLSCPLLSCLSHLLLGSPKTFFICTHQTDLHLHCFRCSITRLRKCTQTGFLPLCSPYGPKLRKPAYSQQHFSEVLWPPPRRQGGTLLQAFNLQAITKSHEKNDAKPRHILKGFRCTTPLRSASSASGIKSRASATRPRATARGRGEVLRALSCPFSPPGANPHSAPYSALEAKDGP